MVESLMQRRLTSLVFEHRHADGHRLEFSDAAIISVASSVVAGGLTIAEGVVFSLQGSQFSFLNY